MKRIASVSIQNKKDISSCTKMFIDKVFTTLIKDKQQLLEKAIAFSNNNTYPELILKQSLLKGCFPKSTWPKQLMLEKADVSSKLEVAYPKEHSDVRFLTELNIANKFATSSELIQKVTFNSEDPRIAIASSTGGNKYKDININFTVEQQIQNIVFDIKSGTNAYDAFKGTWSILPVRDNYQPYTIINDSVFTLTELQIQRMLFLEKAPYVFQKHLVNIKDIVLAYPNDPIFMNMLIQNELLHCIASNVLKKQPSFFTVHKISESAFNEKYFKLLEPYINKNIFDNKENFNQFMSKALRIYKDTIMDISGNVTNNFWKGTGFENIADDIFK